LLGRPLPTRPFAAAYAASLLASLLFALSLAAALGGEPWLGVGLWFLSGAATGAVVAEFHGYSDGLLEAARRLGVKPPRPLLDRVGAALVSLLAPPAAGVLVEAAVENMLSVANAAAAENPSVDLKAIVERLQGEARLEPLGVYAGLSVIPLLLPLLVSKAAVAATVAACIAYESLRTAKGLGDKPCRLDLVDVVVWSKTPGSALDLKLVSEKWGVED